MISIPLLKLFTMQNTSHILMIQPVQFTFNDETAVNNLFQVRTASEFVQTNALYEFKTFIETLQKNGIDVTVIEDTLEPHTPDSIFPNNWISFHKNGSIILYPMFALNRRLERKIAVLDRIREKFQIDKIIDLSYHESENLFLEGTGSMVLDRVYKIAYACLSERTDLTLLNKFCNSEGYRRISFKALDQAGQTIYHTNVMMCVAEEYVVICLDSIANKPEKQAVTDSFLLTNKEIIPISFDQMNRFAGNMLQVKNNSGEKFVVMSTQAFLSLNEEQIEKLEKYNPIIHSDITTIETNGGGSARCMMAEVFLELKN